MSPLWSLSAALLAGQFDLVDEAIAPVEPEADVCFVRRGRDYDLVSFVNEHGDLRALHMHVNGACIKLIDHTGEG